MGKFLALVVTVTVFLVAASGKEWKNFENGKVYSHKTINDKKEVKIHGAHRSPVIEERLLHSHHRDKKMHSQIKANRIQVAEPKEFHSKNAERHHKKNIEEEMHLKPLNERHHKFPNPALLNKIDDSNPPSPQISKQKLIKQAKNGRQNNRRRQRGRRYKRNKFDQKVHALLDNNSDIPLGNQRVNSKVENTTKKTQMEFSKDKKPEIEDMQKATLKNENIHLKIPSYW